MELCFSVPGAGEFLTPREITRDFLSLLNILHDDPSVDFETLIHRSDFSGARTAGSDSMYAEFEL
jgi:hypothetical protein